MLSLCLIADRGHLAEPGAAYDSSPLIIQDGDTYGTEFKSVPVKKGKQS